jgi:iron complex outermembrane receptor protein
MHRAIHLGPVLALTMFPSFVHAQSETSASSSEIPSGEEVVITATRFAQPAQEIPIGVSIITDEQITRSGVNTLPQLLARQPGITVRDNSGNPDQSVDLRGFGITGDQNTLVMVDGQRLSENELTSARWSTIPLSAIDRIEILRGSGAVLYGANATGGVINIITKAPRAGDRDFNVFAGYGSYDTIDLRAGGSVASDRLGLSINGGHYSSDNYRDHNRVQQRNVEASFKTLGSGPKLGVQLGADDQDLQLPGVRTAAQLQTDRRGATTPNDFANRTGWHALFTSAFDLGFGELAVDVGYRKKDAQSSTLIGAQIVAINTTVDSWSANPRLKIPHQLMGGESTLIAGADLSYWEYDSLRDSGPAHVTASQHDEAAYLQHATHWSSGTTFSLGGRLQQTYLKARDEDSFGTNGYQTRRPRAYEAALRQDLPASLSAFAKVGRSFRLQTVDEVYNQFTPPFFLPTVSFLEPQTANNRELGVELKRDTLFFRATAYYMTLENELHFDPISFTNINLPPTRRYGTEVEGNWRVRSWLELGASYTYAVAKFRSGQLSGEDVAGRTVPLVPQHKFSLDANLDFSSDTRLSVRFSYVGSQFFDSDETNSFGQKIPAYRLVDLKLSHRIDKWTLSAAVTNLFNEKYFDYGVRSLNTNTFNAYPQPEQALFFTVEYRTH